MPTPYNVNVYKKGKLVHGLGTSAPDLAQATKAKARLDLQYGDNDPDVEVKIEPIKPGK